MKLLLDENLSPRLLELLAADFSDSTHIEHLQAKGSQAKGSGLYFIGLDQTFQRFGQLALLNLSLDLRHPR